MEEKKKRLIELLHKMDVPNTRIETWDINWLGRNLFIRNGKHPNFQEAAVLLEGFCKPLGFLVFK